MNRQQRRARLRAFAKGQLTYEGACDHAEVAPDFDEGLAQMVRDSGEIQRRWPRYQGGCPRCGRRVILYASAAHYILGDW